MGVIAEIERVQVVIVQDIDGKSVPNTYTVNDDATDEKIYEAALAINTLQSNPARFVRKSVRSELIEM